MSEEQLKAFIEKVKADTSLQQKLKAAADSDAVLAIAKQAGFAINAEDIESTQSTTEPKVTDEELEGASGGTCIAATFLGIQLTAWKPGFCVQGNSGRGNSTKAKVFCHNF